VVPYGSCEIKLNGFKDDGRAGKPMLQCLLIAIKVIGNYGISTTVLYCNKSLLDGVSNHPLHVYAKTPN